MNIETFLEHHGIYRNPFVAEEARLDPVFDQLGDPPSHHPDFPKILGSPAQPAAAIVFGEKGSGKTAIRLTMARELAKHNQQHPDSRVLCVEYEDLNPMLDRLMRAKGQNAERVLESFRLEDHQDAILCQAVTRWVDALLGDRSDQATAALMPSDVKRRIRRMPHQDRVDLAVLASLYDQPNTSSRLMRWGRLRKKLRIGVGFDMRMLWLAAMVFSIVGAGLGLALWWYGESNESQQWLVPVVGIVAAAAVCSWGLWGWGQGRLWRLSQRVRKQMPVTGRTAGEFRRAWRDLSRRQLQRQPLPTTADEAGRDCRYHLMRRFLDLIKPMGYVGMIVLVDRVDEPTLIHGDPDRMIAVMRPMFDNKFLQQDGLGVKLLLPIELRYWIHRESGRFFQEARLDKQNLVDKLTWSGPTLYDLCSARLKVCCRDGCTTSLADMFEPGVGRGALIDALDTMHQPRDAFKFLYAVIQEHCRLVSEEQEVFKIARLTLDTVRRAQIDRLQDLYRGLGPA